MTTKKFTESRSVYWNLYWWSLASIFCGVVMGAFLMWRWTQKNIPMGDVDKSTMVISASSGIASAYPNNNASYQVTLKNVTPRLLWIAQKSKSVSLDKFFVNVWYKDSGEMMRKDPLSVRMILNKPTDGKQLIIRYKIVDPRYDSRAKTLIFRADEEPVVSGENKLSEIPSSFLVSDLVFDADRFALSEYLSGVK